MLLRGCWSGHFARVAAVSWCISPSGRPPPPESAARRARPENRWPGRRFWKWKTRSSRSGRAEVKPFCFLADRFQPVPQPFAEGFQRVGYRANHSPNSNTGCKNDRYHGEAVFFENLLAFSIMASSSSFWRCSSASCFFSSSSIFVLFSLSSRAFLSLSLAARLALILVLRACSFLTALSFCFTCFSRAATSVSRFQNLFDSFWPVTAARAILIRFQRLTWVVQ